MKPGARKTLDEASALSLMIAVKVFSQSVKMERERKRKGREGGASLLGVLYERMRTKCSEKLGTVMAHQCLLNYR